MSSGAKDGPVAAEDEGEVRLDVAEVFGLHQIKEWHVAAVAEKWQ